MLSNRSGMALVLTLMAVSFLVAVTVQLTASVNLQMQGAAHQRNLVQLDAMLLSGLHLARTALLVDQRENTYDSAWDAWGQLDAELVSQLFPGTLDVEVIDLSGRLQINALVLSPEELRRQELQNRTKRPEAQGPRPEGQEEQQGPPQKSRDIMQQELWKRFLLLVTALEQDEEALLSLVDSLADWLDADEEEREHGAEQEYYSTLSPPYLPANGPMFLPEELIFVKGWAPLVSPEQGTQGQRLLDFVTTMGGKEGRINLNTAPPLVIQALHEEIDEELATALVDFREQEENRELLAESDWYKYLPSFPAHITLEQELLTTQSDFFKILVTARIDGIQRRGQGILQRMNNQEQILHIWKVD
jgi:general secretion pathway protein K